MKENYTSEILLVEKQLGNPCIALLVETRVAGTGQTIKNLKHLERLINKDMFTLRAN